MKIGIVTQSIRTQRVALDVANWVKKHADARNNSEFTYEIIDLNDFNLPLLQSTAAESQSIKEVKNWTSKLNEMDGFIFLTAEYNHGITGAFKNALDFMNSELANKPASLIGYGGVGGARAIEQLRLVLAQLAVATTQRNVNLSIMTDFVNYSEFKPNDYQLDSLNGLFDQTETWTKMFKTIR